MEHRTGHEICLAVNARSAEEISWLGRFQGPTGVVQVTRHETGTRGSERISPKRMDQRWPTIRISDGDTHKAVRVCGLLKGQIAHVIREGELRRKQQNSTLTTRFRKQSVGGLLKAG